MTKVFTLSLLLSLLFVCPLPSSATVQAPDCEALAKAAGREAGIPEGILPAIARVESGRNGKAWPWTLNQAGVASYHPTKEAALHQLAEILASGAQNVDLGCMQINWRWHSAEFANASDMLDPVVNTRYAARFLADLRSRLGTWDDAVAAYHSNQPVQGAAYERKVAQARDTILAQHSPPETRAAVSGLTRGLLVLSGRSMILQSERGDPKTGRPSVRLFPGLGRPLITAGN